MTRRLRYFSRLEAGDMSELSRSPDEVMFSMNIDAPSAKNTDPQNLKMVKSPSA
jgi:hypothetical protein